MKHIPYLLPLFILLALTTSLSTAPPARADGGVGPLNFIFSEDTTDDYLEESYSKLDSQLAPFFELDKHWNPNLTATNDGLSSALGEALTLTWSIIPDGTTMPGYAGEPTCASNLISAFNAVYGAGNWEAEIANVFADWSSKTGNRYVRVSDDGASWPNSPGSNTAGQIRGDVRIGGCYIDGSPSGGSILAYNFFPNTGDMKIDTADSYFTNPGNLTTGFHNVISHEHGHGAGIEHVCPVNKTKLMEPFLTTSFIGLQHDDIRAVQRLYGDANEIIATSNDSPATATDLGTPATNSPITMPQISIDDNSDEDWFQFNLTEAKKVDINLTPVGFSYLSGPQNTNGSCSPGTPANSLAVHNLGFQIIDADMTTVLATVNANSAGAAESISDFLLETSGTKYIRVFGDATDDIQLYNLEITLKSAVALTLVKSAAPNPVPVGQPLTYTLRITSTGANTATNVIITDTVPANTTLNPGSLSGNVSYSGVGPGSVITWATNSNLAKNQFLERTFVVTADNGLPNGATIVNTGHVSASNLTTGQNHTNITTVAAPVLTTTVTSNPAVIQSNTSLITFTITLQNIGSATATNTVLTNTYPSSTTYVTNSASHGGTESGGIITWPGITLVAGAAITRTFQVAVSAPITDGDQLVNIISANSEQGVQIQNAAYPKIVGLKRYYFPLIFK